MSERDVIERLDMLIDFAQRQTQDRALLDPELRRVSELIDLGVPLTAAEVARYLRVSRRTVEGWIQRGAIASVHWGGCRRVPARALRACEAERSTTSDNVPSATKAHERQERG